EKPQTKYILQVAFALLALICFLMPMFQISAWKNVSLKNDSNGNGITMLSIATDIQSGLSSIVRKAKLPQEVTTTIVADANQLVMTGWATLAGFIGAAMLFVLVFLENLGVQWGKWRTPLIVTLCAAGILSVIVGMIGFHGFAERLNAAASVTDEALQKVTAKLYQGDHVPVFTVSGWAWAGMAALLLLLGVQLLPQTKGSLRKSLMWFVLPALCMYSFFVILPAISSVYLGFTSYDGVTEASMRFIGFDNYVNIFQSARFGSATVNTLIIAASFTVFVNLLALALAIAVDRVRWIKNVFRSAFYLPVLISGIIAGFIWRIMFNYSFGVLNFVLNALGMESAKFIDVMPNALLSIIFVLLWKQVGYYMIIYLAALQGISADLMEAASIDGANSRQTFRHITLPMLAGSFTINLTLALINGLKIFDEIAILTDGGPGFSTETITYMVYKVAFGEMRQGYGTAMAVILFLIILVLGGLQSTILRKREVRL
ncbi:MAG: sugar ABC transporter permease, partial [Eubacteriales bacterium]|nr:sugar ABC transporter permease [Eubacteriales bacterium]